MGDVQDGYHLLLTLPLHSFKSLFLRKLQLEKTLSLVIANCKKPEVEYKVCWVTSSA